MATYLFSSKVIRSIQVNKSPFVHDILHSPRAILCRDTTVLVANALCTGDKKPEILGGKKKKKKMGIDKINVGEQQLTIEKWLSVYAQDKYPISIFLERNL